MKVLVIYCHPDPGSFTAAVRDPICARLFDIGAELRLRDLYDAQGFQPVMDRAEWQTYLHPHANRVPLSEHMAALEWRDALIFVYPTWWYGLPAMLKGWLDRVVLAEVTFLTPDAQNATIRPRLDHITRLGVLTTCGASFWLTSLIGESGKRTLLRAIGYLCAPKRRSVFAAHDLMDSASPSSRQRHLAHVGRKMDRLLARFAKDPRSSVIGPISATLSSPRLNQRAASPSCRSAP